MTRVQSGGLPLSGVRVLDLTSELGALCPRLLAGMGADIVRIEPPGGHSSRRRGPFVHGLPHPERSLYWFQMNADKRSLTLNPATADGRALLLRLVERAAIIVESQPPRALAALGLGWEVLHKRNPHLVMTAISPFGQSGPRASDPASDLIGMAAGGLMFLNGDADRPPLRVSVEQGYAQAGIHAAAATMVAWHGRQASGEGVYVDVSMQEALTWTLNNNRLLYSHDGQITHRTGGGRAGGGGTRIVYQASDGYIAFYRRPENHIALQGWIDDAGITLDFRVDEWQLWSQRGLPEPPRERVQTMEAALAAYFLGLKATEIMREGQRRGLYIAAAMTPQDLYESDHLRSRGFWQEVLHPELSAIYEYPGAPFQMPASPWRTPRRAPLCGEHTRAILCDELGLSAGDLALLKAGGTI